MSRARIILHPMLIHPRSRFIMFLFLFIALVVGGISWFLLDQAVKAIGVSLFYGPPSPNPLVSLMLSPYIRFLVIFGSGLLAAGFTAHHVVGPVKHIEAWLLEAEDGRANQPLRIREGDKFTKLVDLINRLHPLS